MRLFYRLVGTGRDTIVVVNGGPGLSMNYLSADLEPLATRHVLLFYDQRGSGRATLVTDSTSLDAQRFADDLEALRSHFGIDRLTVLGHSWGAGVVALYALRHPERFGRLLIVGPIPARGAGLSQAFKKLNDRRDSIAQRRLQELSATRNAKPGDAAVCRAFFAAFFLPAYYDSVAARRSRGDMCAGTPEALSNVTRSVDRLTLLSLGEWDWRTGLRRITARTLVIHGTADFIPLESSREWAAALPNSRLLVFERSGHFPYVEVPQRFFAAVEEFLEGRWPAGAEAVSKGGAQFTP